jgi:hypothetical protein
MVTWNELVRLEPELLVLEEDVSAVKPVVGFCANRVWYSEFKPRLVALVGLARPVPGVSAYVVPKVSKRFPTVAELYGADWDEYQRQRAIALKGIDDTLWGSEAYDVAYRELYDMLPNCNHSSDCVARW